ncbi:uncharacterized protein LOC6574587 [Drosophila mojavensis]|uniref:Beta-defensin n=2 Tax=mojavensis species complex TaxID=198037 RepID=A0A0Q9X1G3_DROMO|nr:uncharacterized protein LOC6574587 [Drosophila mojavensis]XP_017857778.1 PREDICTED: uncharacterized protein LOC108610285 [Drosophila arizonae]KRG01919.1 uncharacterized protein Dmoj_GI22422 [Drosophila mojavensis]
MSTNSVGSVTSAAVLLISLVLVGDCLACRPVYRSDLVSCTRSGGVCREVSACPKNRHAGVKTICILRGKVCCMKAK